MGGAQKKNNCWIGTYSYTYIDAGGRQGQWNSIKAPSTHMCAMHFLVEAYFSIRTVNFALMLINTKDMNSHKYSLFWRPTVLYFWAKKRGGGGTGSVAFPKGVTICRWQLLYSVHSQDFFIMITENIVSAVEVGKEWKLPWISFTVCSFATRSSPNYKIRGSICLAKFVRLYIMVVSLKHYFPFDSKHNYHLLCEQTFMLSLSWKVSSVWFLSSRLSNELRKTRQAFMYLLTKGQPFGWASVENVTSWFQVHTPEEVSAWFLSK